MRRARFAVSAALSAIAVDLREHEELIRRFTWCVRIGGVFGCFTGPRFRRQFVAAGDSSRSEPDAELVAKRSGRFALIVRVQRKARRALVHHERRTTILIAHAVGAHTNTVDSDPQAAGRGWSIVLFSVQRALRLEAIC